MAGVSDDERYRMLGRDETLALEPMLRRERLYGAALYYEYLTDDARLVIEVVKSAAALGAVIANYAEVDRLRRSRTIGSRGVTCATELTGDDADGARPRRHQRRRTVGRRGAPAQRAGRHSRACT